MVRTLIINFILCCTTSAKGLSLGDFDAHAFDNVIIIPDIHGDIDNLMYSLWLGARQTSWPEVSYETIEAALVGSGALPAPAAPPARTAVVQLGDVANRGPGSKQCFTIMSTLERLFGWKVISLFGNHELMVFTGEDQRYVHQREHEFFGGKARRANAYGPRGALWKSISSNYLLTARLTGGGDGSRSDVDTLFVHGGMTLSWLGRGGEVSVHSLNTKVRETMRSPAAAKGLLSPPDSPLWTRSFIDNSSSEEWCNSELQTLLDIFQVSRIVVGHSPLESKRAESKCGGRVILTDVMLSRWMGSGGQPVAVVMRISNEGNPRLESMTAHYYDPETRMEDAGALWPHDEGFEEGPETTDGADSPLSALVSYVHEDATDDEGDDEDRPETDDDSSSDYDDEDDDTDYLAAFGG